MRVYIVGIYSDNHFRCYLVIIDKTCNFDLTKLDGFLFGGEIQVLETVV